MSDGGKKYKLALVDDQILFRDAIADVLNKFCDCQVVLLATNGKELLDNLIREDLPDLVVLDLAMPEMDGYETATRLKKRYGNIKILILTMYDSELVTVRLLQAGVRGVLTKDCHPGELHSAIVSIMETGYYYSGSTTNKILSLIKNGDNKGPNVLLNDTELRFLELASQDMTYKEIAQIMKISYRTVDNYRDSLFSKLNVKSRVGLVLFAMKNGIIKSGT